MYSLLIMWLCQHWRECKVADTVNKMMHCILLLHQCITNIRFKKLT